MFAFGLGHYLRDDSSSDDPQGGSNLWCDDEKLSSIPNGTDMEVSGHRTNCNTVGSDSVAYVHLHPKGQSESRSTLIFRYDGNDPNMRWIDDHHISIQADNISDVSKQVTLLEDISISYDLSIIDTSKIKDFLKKLEHK